MSLILRRLAYPLHAPRRIPLAPAGEESAASRSLTSFFGAILRQRRSRKLRNEPGCRLAMRASTEG